MKTCIQRQGSWDFPRLGHYLCRQIKFLSTSAQSCALCCLRVSFIAHKTQAVRACSASLSQLLVSHNSFRCDSDTSRGDLRMPQTPAVLLHSQLAVPCQLYQQTPTTHPRKPNPQNQPTKGGADSKCQPHPAATDGKRAQSKV